MSEAVGAGEEGSGGEPDDLALLGGRIITLDTNSSIAEAVLISGGRIRAVGSTREVAAACRRECRRIELEDAPSYRASSTAMPISIVRA